MSSQDGVEETADAIGVLIRDEENDACLSLRDAQLDPALFVVEWLIGDDREAKLLGVKT